MAPEQPDSIRILHFCFHLLTIHSNRNIVSSMNERPNMSTSDFVRRKEQQFEAACRRDGLSQTSQRRAVLAALARRTDHPTADQLYEELHPEFKGLSRTTVYRVLETLVGIGLIRRITSMEAKARFDADTSRHHHLICLECGVVSDVHDPSLNLIELPANQAGGFRFLDYSITFTGICPHCLQATADSRISGMPLPKNRRPTPKK
jgi:Fur family peroxide stress response transcriptional regulator